MTCLKSDFKEGAKLPDLKKFKGTKDLGPWEQFQKWVISHAKSLAKAKKLYPNMALSESANNILYIATKKWVKRTLKHTPKKSLEYEAAMYDFQFSCIDLGKTDWAKDTHYYIRKRRK